MEIEAPRNEKIRWYRTPLDPDALRSLQERSDLRGFLQTLGYLGLLVLTGGSALWSFGQGRWGLTLAALFCHGTVMSFSVNGFHELVHGTVFKTKAFNGFFLQVVSFLGWHNPHHFWASHSRHHISTLHPPDDLEVVLPQKMTLRDYFKSAFLNYGGFRWALSFHFRLARGRLEGDWEHRIFPDSRPADRLALFRFSRILLAGHGLILILSLARGWWLLPLVLSLGNFYGGWLFIPHNQCQHIGLMDKVPDFRLCARTILVNPLFSFLYWRMNYHIEHHMYAAVPCYNLPKLHRLIRHDLPPSPRGLIRTWREIAAIQERQKADPSYQFRAALPPASTGREAARA